MTRLTGYSVGVVQYDPSFIQRLLSLYNFARPSPFLPRPSPRRSHSRCALVRSSFLRTLPVPFRGMSSFSKRIIAGMQCLGKMEATWAWSSFVDGTAWSGRVRTTALRKRHEASVSGCVCVGEGGG